jgi:alpha-glucosidase
MTHSDIGGALGEKKTNTRTNQMLVRWMEMAVFSSAVLRSHPSIIPDEVSQLWDDDIIPYARGLAGLWQLFRNYRAQLFVEAAETGMPPVRHGALVYPDDATWWQSTDSWKHNVHENLHVCPYGHQVGLKQFFLGDDVMVAQLFKEYDMLEMRADGLSIKKLSEKVYIPDGTWTYLWGVNENYEGPQWIEQSVQLGRPNVYWRANSKYSIIFLKAAADFRLKNVGPVNGVKAFVTSRIKKSEGLSTFVDAVKRVTGRQQR